MAIGKCIPGNPVVIGGSAIRPGLGTVQFYSDQARTIQFTDPTAQAVYANLDGRHLADSWVQKGAISVGAGDVNTATGADAVVAYPAQGTGKRNAVLGIAWSYDSPPSSGQITIESPSGVPVFGPMPITSGGPGFFPLGRGVAGLQNSALLVRLASGGPGVKGVVSVEGHEVQ